MSISKSLEKKIEKVCVQIQQLIDSLRNEMCKKLEKLDKIEAELNDLKVRVGRIEDRVRRVEDEVMFLRVSRLARAEAEETIHQERREYIDLGPIYGPDPTGINAPGKVPSERF